MTTATPTLVERCKASKHMMTVLNARHQDCTNNGITVQIDNSYIHVWVALIDGHLLRYHQARDLVRSNHFMDDNDLVVALPRDGRPNLLNPPAAMWVGGLRRSHVMAGGNFVHTSNGITHDALLGYKAPLSVHDRIE